MAKIHEHDSPAPLQPQPVELLASGVACASLHPLRLSAVVIRRLKRRVRTAVWAWERSVAMYIQVAKDFVEEEDVLHNMCAGSCNTGPVPFRMAGPLLGNNSVRWPLPLQWFVHLDAGTARGCPFSRQLQRSTGGATYIRRRSLATFSGGGSAV